MNARPGFPGFPLFDTADLIHEQAELALYPDLRAALDAVPINPDKARQDFYTARRFLEKYSDVSGTYNRFRSEIQRFLNYTWLIARRHLARSEEHTSELQSRPHLVCRLLLEKKQKLC